MIFHKWAAIKQKKICCTYNFIFGLITHFSFMHIYGHYISIRRLNYVAQNVLNCFHAAVGKEDTEYLLWRLTAFEG